MNPFTSRRKQTYSRRSQASFQKQRELEEEIYRLAGWIAVAENNVKRLTETERNVKNLMIEGQVTAQQYGDAARKLGDEKLRLETLNEKASSLREQIKRLEAPSPAEASERLKGQRALAGVAGERLSLDSEIAAVVEQLRAMLEKRGALSAAMRAHASAIGLAVSQDILDERRFEALLESLPDGVGEKSRDWAAWFCGMRAPGLLGCTVTRALTLPETLAHSGLYGEGEVVYLAPGRAAELAASGYVALPAEYAPARAAQELAAAAPARR